MYKEILYRNEYGVLHVSCFFFRFAMICDGHMSIEVHRQLDGNTTSTIIAVTSVVALLLCPLRSQAIQISHRPPSTFEERKKVLVNSGQGHLISRVSIYAQLTFSPHTIPQVVLSCKYENSECDLVLEHEEFVYEESTSRS